MTQTIEVNLIDVLNRLETKIDSLDQKIDTKFDYLDKKIDTEVNSLNNKIDTKFDSLDKKIDTEVNSLNNKIDTKFDSLDRKFDKLSEEFKDIKVDIATLKEGQNGMSKRLDNNETRLNILISVMFSGLLGIIAKLVFIK
jgi:chromosome segregation ATPase